MNELTEKQSEMFNYLIDFIQDNGYQPSYFEMAEYFGVTKKTIADRILALEKKGYLKRNKKHEARCIIILYGRFEYFPARIKD